MTISSACLGVETHGSAIEQALTANRDDVVWLNYRRPTIRGRSGVGTCDEGEQPDN